MDAEMSDSDEATSETIGSDTNDVNPVKEYVRRTYARVIRYVRYKLQTDPENYYREQCLLFIPWRNERKEIENVNTEELYHTTHLDDIAKTRTEYNVMSDEAINEILEQVNDAENEEEDEEKKDVDDEQKPEADLFVQVGVVGGKDKGTTGNHFFSPQKFGKDKIFEMLQILNERQRMIVMHIYKCFVNGENLPMHIFLSRSAGVGKSTVINAIYQLLSHHFDNLPGKPVTDTIKVLLRAFAGKAAFLINGSTLHTAFAPPVNQCTNMLELSADIANKIRTQLRDLKLLIIDEISMVGRKQTVRVSTRLVQVMGVNAPFGGVSVIIVGDLNQLPPVFDKAIYESVGDSDLSILAGPHLFEEFHYFELTEIMRQQNEKDFITALNNMAVGDMTENDIELIRTRQMEEKMVPADAIRLYPTNEEVDKYNDRRLMQDEYILYWLRMQFVAKSIRKRKQVC